MRPAPAFDLVGRAGHHERDFVMVGILESELDIRTEAAFQTLERIANSLIQNGLIANQAAEGFLADAVEQVGFVLEIEIDGSGRVFDFLRDFAHGDVLKAFPHKQIAGGVENLLAWFLFLAGSTFLAPNVTSVKFRKTYHYLTRYGNPVPGLGGEPIVGQNGLFDVILTGV